MFAADSVENPESSTGPWSRLSSSHREPLRFSIVIANYNYERYLARAIESALDQDWPEIEVIVVDDGSVDNSRQVITGYGDRIEAVFQANRGQRAANNRGFARSSGDVIVFLDADDVLLPDFASSVASVWRPGISKVQVAMRRVDADERPTGSVIPPISAPPSAEQIRRWASRTSEYPTPPGSGNAYSREFLQSFFPIGDEDDTSTNSTCLALAPFLGDVVTVIAPLALYRQHGRNDSNLFADKGRFGREVARALRRQRSAERVCVELGAPVPEKDCVFLGWHLLQLRIASLRTDRESHPIAGDNTIRALRDLLRSMQAGGFEKTGRRAAALCWAIATLLAPAPLARLLVRNRFTRG